MKRMDKIVLITGGARSGKSEFALEYTSQFNHKVFIATAEPIDNEMSDRIEMHKGQRGLDFITIEEPIDLAKTVSELDNSIDIAVIDCLTVWLGNLFHKINDVNLISHHIEHFITNICQSKCTFVIISNEIGMGIVPANGLARQFRDQAGNLNKRIAQVADLVILMVSGLPLTIKGHYGQD